ncbi:unnamed protein product [Linum tenue]|uniref:HVA22-like protein n=1 Tax=Linum tenue TaxID=586396 RepID=A0AAV0KDR1_9ROSI|nr:unnamed protein product [Linum tenue]
MALLAPSITSEVGLRLLLSPIGSNVVTRAACCSVGIVLPVYSTYQALEADDETQQRKWLIYWAAYGSFSLAEVFADKLLSWVPMYYHMKFAFLVWLQLPSADGAAQLYRKHLRPFLLKHQARVDLLMNSAYKEAARLISSHQAEIDYATSVYLKIKGTDEGATIARSHETARQPRNDGDDESSRNT